jgi:hypothetical protein
MGSKRGVAGMSMVLYALLDILLVALFLAAVTIRVSDATNDQTYYQRFIARDLALTVDALHAAEGSFSMKYAYATPKKSELDVELGYGRVSLYPSSQRNNTQKSASSFLFGQNENITIMNSTLHAVPEIDEIYSREFIIAKNASSILLKERRGAE